MLPEGEVFMEMADSYTMPEHFVSTGTMEKRILLWIRKHCAPCILTAQLEWGRDLGSMSLCPPTTFPLSLQVHIPRACSRTSSDQSPSWLEVYFQEMWMQA